VERVCSRAAMPQRSSCCRALRDGARNGLRGCLSDGENCASLRNYPEGKICARKAFFLRRRKRASGGVPAGTGEWGEGGDCQAREASETLGLLHPEPVESDGPPRDRCRGSVCQIFTEMHARRPELHAASIPNRARRRMPRYVPDIRGPVRAQTHNPPKHDLHIFDVHVLTRPPDHQRAAGGHIVHSPKNPVSLSILGMECIARRGSRFLKPTSLAKNPSLEGEV
jgi:hypothetical protein